jgi:hypothetical protein
VEVTEVGRNHELESLVQGPYRVLENSVATFRLSIGAEDLRVSSDRVTPAHRRKLSPPPERNPTPSDPVPPAPMDGTPSSPPIYRSEGQPRRPGKRRVRIDLPFVTNKSTLMILDLATKKDCGEGLKTEAKRRTSPQGQSISTRKRPIGRPPYLRVM